MFNCSVRRVTSSSLAILRFEWNTSWSSVSRRKDANAISFISASSVGKFISILRNSAFVRRRSAMDSRFRILATVRSPAFEESKYQTILGHRIRGLQKRYSTTTRPDSISGLVFRKYPFNTPLIQQSEMKKRFAAGNCLDPMYSLLSSARRRTNCHSPDRAA